MSSRRSMCITTKVPILPAHLSILVNIHLVTTEWTLGIFIHIPFFDWRLIYFHPLVSEQTIVFRNKLLSLFPCAEDGLDVIIGILTGGDDKDFHASNKRRTRK